VPSPDGKRTIRKIQRPFIGGLLKLYTLRELADEVGVRPSKVDYYVRLGLLDVAHSSDAGYRIFTEENLSKLREILRLKDKGLSLEEIRSLMG